LTDEEGGGGELGVSDETTKPPDEVGVVPIGTGGGSTGTGSAELSVDTGATSLGSILISSFGGSTGETGADASTFVSGIGATGGIIGSSFGASAPGLKRSLKGEMVSADTLGRSDDPEELDERG
jgi:hypothetical protein